MQERANDSCFLLRVCQTYAQAAIRGYRGLWSGCRVRARNGKVLETLDPDDSGIHTGFGEVGNHELAAQSYGKLYAQSGDRKRGAGEFYAVCQHVDGVLTVG